MPHFNAIIVQIFILSILTISILQGAVLRVPQDYSTIQSAIDVANQGDTIVADVGIYYEHVVINKPLTLQGAGIEKTIIDATQNGSTRLPGILLIDVQNVVIYDITIQNAGEPYDEALVDTGQCGIIMDNCSQNTITRVQTKNSGLFGMYLWNNADKNVISHCQIDGMRPAHPNYFDLGGIGCSGGAVAEGGHDSTNDGNVLDANEISNCVYAVSLTASRFTEVTHSNFNPMVSSFWNINGGFLSYGVNIFASSNNTIEKDTVRGHAQIGIRLLEPTSGDPYEYAGSSNGNIVSNVIFQSNQMYGATIKSCHRNFFTRNYFDTAQNANVYLYDGASGNTFYRNTFINAASMISALHGIDNLQGAKVSIGGPLGRATASTGGGKDDKDILLNVKKHKVLNLLALSNVTAEDDGTANFWDDGIVIGNKWSDFSSNALFPSQYSVPGTAGSIDHHPLGRYNGSVTGTVFHDNDGDGIQDQPNEIPLEGLEIVATNGSTVYRDTTDANGDYSIILTFEGDNVWTISQTVKPGWMLTLPSSAAYEVTADGSSHMGYDFGDAKFGAIRGRVFHDRNSNRIKDDSEDGLSGWAVYANAQDPSKSKSIITENDGSYSFENLRLGTYSVSEELPTGWVRTTPISNQYAIIISSGIDTSGLDFGNATRIDTVKFRTFSVESLAVKKGVKRKTIAIKWCFDFKNTTGRSVDGMHIEFTKQVMSFSTIAPFTSVVLISPIRNGWDFTGASINDGQIVQTCGVGSKSGMKIIRWWWTYQQAVVGGLNGRKVPYSQVPLFPMPNTANLRDEVFAQGGFPPTETNPSGGMNVGIPRAVSAYPTGWVMLYKSSSMLKSLKDRFGVHFEMAYGFNVFNNGAPFIGEQRELSPAKQNNRLFAENVALKFNIAASALGKTPPGLGELIYDEGTNPLSGMELKEIALHADSLMTLWRGTPLSSYWNADSTIRKINSAFEGAMDTVSFAGKLVLKGVRRAGEVPFLRYDASITPTIITPDATFTDKMPEVFILHQNYPNPFNPATTISFDVPDQAYVTLKVYNILGEEIVTLLDHQQMDEGHQEIVFSADNLASGVYFYRIITTEIEAEDEQLTPARRFEFIKKMILLK